jgi:NADPH:quinone reductase-like Zn-dependent oxidoreductase
MVQMDQEEPGTVQMVNAAIQTLADAGQITTLIGPRFTLADAPRALETLARRQAIGKVIVDVRPEA